MIRTMVTTLAVGLAWTAGNGWGAAASKVQFDTGLEGLQSTANPASRVWTWSGDAAQVTYPASSQPPAPGQYSNLKAENGVSGGDFTGDYLAAGVKLLGFDVYAATVLPTAGFRVEIRSGTNMVFRDVKHMITSPGTWHRIAVPLDRAAGGWLPADEDLFEDVLRSVDEVCIRAARSTTKSETYRLDNLFLGRLHGGASAWEGESGSPSGSVTWMWDDVMDGWTYRIEATTNMASGEWTPVGTVTATGDVLTFIDDDADNHPARVYRLVLQ